MGTKGVVAILVSMAILLTVVSVAKADRVDDLIQLLIDKGTISKDEGTALKKKLGPEAPAQQQQASAQQEEWTKKIEVGYNKGAYIKTPDGRFSLRTNVGLQGQFNYQWLEGQEDKTTFQVKRARLWFTGNAFESWLKYYTQITLEQSVNLRDAYMEADYYKAAVPRVGQYKVPFDREFLTSAFNLQLIDRSIANNQFNLGRDIGVQVAGFPLGDLFEYRVGMFNGSGANQDNVNTEYMYVGRAVLTPFGPYAYSQAALDDPKKPLLAIGVAGAYMPGLDPGERRILAGVLGSTSVVPVKSDVSELVGDMAFKLHGFSFEGGYYYRIIDPKAPTRFGSTNAWGYYAQAGYFLIPKKFEVAARYSYMNPDTPTQRANNNQYEVTGGVS